MDLAHVPTLPLTGCVPLGKLLTLFDICFLGDGMAHETLAPQRGIEPGPWAMKAGLLHLQNRQYNSTFLLGLLSE